MVETIWRRWKHLAETLGTFQARLILSLFYILVIVPLGLIYKYKKPLKQNNGKTAWTPKASFGFSTLKELSSQ